MRTWAKGMPSKQHGLLSEQLEARAASRHIPVSAYCSFHHDRTADKLRATIIRCDPLRRPAVETLCGNTGCADRSGKRTLRSRHCASTDDADGLPEDPREFHLVLRDRGKDFFCPPYSSRCGGPFQSPYPTCSLGRRDLKRSLGDS